MLEFLEVVDYQGAEEGGAVFECRLVDDDGGALGLDPFHDTLDARLAEVVGMTLHGQAIDTDDALMFAVGVVSVVVVVAVVAGLAQHLVGDEVLTGAVALHDGLYEVLGYVFVVGQQLFGVFWQAVAAVAEGGVVVERSDARV